MYVRLKLLMQRLREGDVVARPRSSQVTRRHDQESEQPRSELNNAEFYIYLDRRRNAYNNNHQNATTIATATASTTASTNGDDYDNDHDLEYNDTNWPPPHNK